MCRLLTLFESEFTSETGSDNVDLTGLETHYVDEADLKLVEVLLPLPSQCLDYRCLY